MDMNFMLAPANIIKKQAIAEIIKCNEYTSKYGLSLTSTQALELVNTRSEALSNNGRIEFGGGIIDKLIKVFCDSSFIWQDNYEETIHQLIDTFYYYKNESLDSLSDDDLILIMKKYFETSCYGSIQLLQNRELDKIAHDIRFGIQNDDSQEEDIDEEGEDEY